jgi:hypothetical protein
MPLPVVPAPAQWHKNVSRGLIVAAYADTMQRIAADGSR